MRVEWKQTASKQDPHQSDNTKPYIFTLTIWDLWWNRLRLPSPWICTCFGGHPCPWWRQHPGVSIATRISPLQHHAMASHDFLSDKCGPATQPFRNLGTASVVCFNCAFKTSTQFYSQLRRSLSSLDHSCSGFCVLTLGKHFLRLLSRDLCRDVLTSDCRVEFYFQKLQPFIGRVLPLRQLYHHPSVDSRLLFNGTNLFLDHRCFPCTLFVHYFKLTFLSEASFPFSHLSLFFLTVDPNKSSSP